MKEPKIPENESSRLKDLQSFDILDTPAQIEFDEITLLASTICKTPIALVSLIDSDRQWFKSSHGIDATETPRNVSFCAHAINQDDLFEIPNALDDERFRDNPLTTREPKVVFYAGHPLISAKGHKLGTLCVIDHKPRELNQEQKDAFKVLAKHVITQMEFDLSTKKLKKSLHKIESQKKELIHTSKMQALGIMASEIAHEINNPLCIIDLYTKRIIKSIEKGEYKEEELINSCEMISNTVGRISDIIQSLKSISRDSSLDIVEKIKLKKIIDDVLILCQSKTKYIGLEVQVENSDDSVNVFFNPGQLAQVIINLITNSVDAIEDKKDKWIKLIVTDEEQFIKLSCIDSGLGISKESIEKIMDPFFTTKDPGKGTGLGLSISSKIMSLSGGSLSYDQSAPNTKFDILIPKNKITNLVE